MNRILELTNVVLSSKTIEISEGKSYLELLNRVCFYDYANLNGALLPHDETTLTKAQTLVDAPVVAKYTVDQYGKPSFKGHEVSIDSDGEVVFGTTPIGVHTNVYIQDDLVEVSEGNFITLPCLFANIRVWKRNRNAVNAVRRLFEEGRLHNSWEISVSKYEFVDGTKRIIDYEFIGNCLLGWDVPPAFGRSAEVLSVATESTELLVAEAVSQDLIEAGENESNGNEVQDMDKEKATLGEITAEKLTTTSITTDQIVESSISTARIACTGITSEKIGAATIEELPAGEQEELKVEETEPTSEPIVDVEKAELTMRDIRTKIEDQIYVKTKGYMDVVFIFPDAKKVWAHVWEEKETDIYEFDYEIQNDEVILSDPIAVTLVVSPRNINSAFDEKNSALIEAQKQINDLEMQISELAPFKEAAEKAALEKAEAEKQEQIAELRKYAEDSGVVTSEELDEGDVHEMIASLNVTELKVLIADRIVQKQKKAKPATETASARKQAKPRAMLDEAEITEKPGNVLMSWLHK